MIKTIIGYQFFSFQKRLRNERIELNLVFQTQPWEL